MRARQRLASLEDNRRRRAPHRPPAPFRRKVPPAPLLAPRPRHGAVRQQHGPLLPGPHGQQERSPGQQLAHDGVAAADGGHLPELRLPRQGGGPAAHGEQEAPQPAQRAHRLQRLPDHLQHVDILRIFNERLGRRVQLPLPTGGLLEQPYSYEDGQHLLVVLFLQVH